MDVSGRIAELKAERNAIVLAHNYCLPEVQDLADMVGDSLGLSVEASRTDADVIVFCGVTFMAETAKILSPDKTVLIPEPAAVCAMAQMCTPEEIRAAREADPGCEVVGYVNSTAACKAEMDVCCTSSNVVDIVSSTRSRSVILVPDGNLGSYAADRCPDREVGLWHGFCPVHQAITRDQVLRLKGEHPGAPVMAHPECRREVLGLADFIGSTEAMIGFARSSGADGFVVLTERGMSHRLETEVPGKGFWFPESAVCGVMKMCTPEALLRCLEGMSPEVTLPDDVIERARVPVRRMIGGARSRVHQVLDRPVGDEVLQLAVVDVDGLEGDGYQVGDGVHRGHLVEVALDDLEVDLVLVVRHVEPAVVDGVVQRVQLGDELAAGVGAEVEHQVAVDVQRQVVVVRQDDHAYGQVVAHGAEDDGPVALLELQVEVAQRSPGVPHDLAAARGAQQTAHLFSRGT